MPLKDPAVTGPVIPLQHDRIDIEQQVGHQEPVGLGQRTKECRGEKDQESYEGVTCFRGPGVVFYGLLVWRDYFSGKYISKPFFPNPH